MSSDDNLRDALLGMIKGTVGDRFWQQLTVGSSDWQWQMQDNGDIRGTGKLHEYISQVTRHALRIDGILPPSQDEVPKLRALAERLQTEESHAEIFAEDLYHDEEVIIPADRVRQFRSLYDVHIGGLRRQGEPERLTFPPHATAHKAYSLLREALRMTDNEKVVPRLKQLSNAFSNMIGVPGVNDRNQWLQNYDLVLPLAVTLHEGTAAGEKLQEVHQLLQSIGPGITDYCGRYEACLQYRRQQPYIPARSLTTLRNDDDAFYGIRYCQQLLYATAADEDSPLSLPTGILANRLDNLQTLIGDLRENGGLLGVDKDRPDILRSSADDANAILTFFGRNIIHRLTSLCDHNLALPTTTEQEQAALLQVREFCGGYLAHSFAEAGIATESDVTQPAGLLPEIAPYALRMPAHDTARNTMFDIRQWLRTLPDQPETMQAFRLLDTALWRTESLRPLPPTDRIYLQRADQTLDELITLAQTQTPERADDVIGLIEKARTNLHTVSGRLGLGSGQSPPPPPPS